MNDFKKLQDEFKIFANNYGFKHLNNKQQELNENLIKTGDYIQILIDNKKSYEYTIILYIFITYDLDFISVNIVLYYK